MNEEVRPVMKNKTFGALMMFIGALGVALIIMRVVFYKFEYDPQHYPVDYGRWNFFSYFTVQSNMYVCFYLICLALAVFGKEKAKNIAFNPFVRLTVTVYIIVTGAVYCGGIPLKMTPPLHWTDFNQILLSFVQVFHHMIIPPLMIILFFIAPVNRKIKMKSIYLVGIYPLVYSVLSIIRGAVGKAHFFVYPFYQPEFFWNMFFKGKEMNAAAGYLFLIPMLFAGISIFLILALILSAIYNKACIKKDAQSV